MLILALDLRKFKTMCCFFDTKTRKPAFQVVATERDYLSKVFKSRNVDLVVMEAFGEPGTEHSRLLNQRRRSEVVQCEAQDRQG